MLQTSLHYSFFFFNDTATTEIYTLSLHDALPIYCSIVVRPRPGPPRPLKRKQSQSLQHLSPAGLRSEEHTSELQSQSNLVCRLLLEKKKKQIYYAPLPSPHHCHVYLTHSHLCSTL